MIIYRGVSTAQHMAQLGVVCERNGQYVAKIETLDLGTRYKFTGPPRGDDEQQASQDLCYIRAAAEGTPTRVGGLQAMQSAASETDTFHFHLRSQSERYTCTFIHT